MRVKNDGTLIKDYRVLKNRELFLKLFKDFEWDLNLHKRYFEEKGLEKKYNFMHSDFYLDKKKEFIREMLYFKYSNELPHFSKNFFSVPGYYGYNKGKKFVDEKGNETGERIGFYLPRTHWYKILEFATPEVSICDYKAFCNYVKKEIGLYDFEQIPRIKAVLDKRRELVKEWSIKFREFASKYFDLSNVVEVEDEELIEAFTDYYWYPDNYFIKHCLRSEFRELLDKDLQDLESLRQKYDAFEKANPIPYRFSRDKYIPLSAESSEVTQVDDMLYFKFIKEYMWHTRDSYNMDSHLFRRFAAAPVAKLLTVEVLKYIIDNLVYFRWWYGGLYDADYDSDKYENLLYKRAIRDRIFLINFVNFNNEYKIGGTRMLGSYENVYKFTYFCGDMTEAYLDRIFGCGSFPHRGYRPKPYINAEELLGPVVLNQKRKGAFIKLTGRGGDDALDHNVISTTVDESFSSHYNAIVKHKDTGEVIKDKGSLKGYKGDFYRNFSGGKYPNDENLLLSIEHFDFNSVLKDPSPVESTEFTDAYIDYMEFCFEKYLEDNKHYLSGSESDFIYYKVTDKRYDKRYDKKTYDRVPARLLDLQLNLGDFFYYLASRYDEEEIRIDWKRVLR